MSGNTGLTLVVVESPTKVDTLEKYLGDAYVVKASYGHISDLPRQGGINVDRNTLEMKSEVMEDKKSTLDKIMYYAKKADRIVLATDPDREGEAISEALRRELKITDYDRCTFNEITKSAVQNALANPRKIDNDLLHAQMARRIIDRITGWQGTDALTKHLGRLSPVGRIQSQIVNLIVKREQEIESFVVTEHYTIRSWFDSEKWTANLDVKKSGLGEQLADAVDEDEDDESDTDSEVAKEHSKPFYWLDKKLSDEVAKKIKTMKVINSVTKVEETYAPPAFQTSTMQQVAVNKLGIKTAEVDDIANKLYQAGLVTYIRTDSTHLSDDGYALIKDYADSHGLKMADKKREGKRGAVAQEAHEALRPTSFEYLGDDLKGNEQKLYKLIWARALASQLEPMLHDVTELTLVATVDGKDYVFTARGSALKHKGWSVVYEDPNAKSKNEEAKNPVPSLEVGTELTVDKSQRLTSKTKAPSYFTESSLNKYLEKRGISRPSTTAKLFTKVGEKGHGYIRDEKIKKKTYLRPNATALDLVSSLDGRFSIMNETFTKDMEKKLDDIANGLLDYEDFVREYWDLLDTEEEKLRAAPSPVKTEPCIECGKQMVRWPGKGKSYYWRCTDKQCDAIAYDRDGVPVSREQVEAERQERLKPFINDDGSAKFPCRSCESPLIRMATKKNENVFVWGCSNKDCDYFDFDDTENKRPLQDKMDEVAKEFSDENGDPLYPCPNCRGHLISATASSGNLYWHCINRSKTNKEEKCDYVTWNKKEDNTPMSKEEKERQAQERENKKPDWLKEIIKNSTDEKGNYLWHCARCREKAPLYKKEKKDGSGFYFQCSNKGCGERYWESESKPGTPDKTKKKGKKTTLKLKPKGY